MDEAGTQLAAVAAANLRQHFYRCLCDGPAPRVADLVEQLLGIAWTLAAEHGFEIVGQRDAVISHVKGYHETRRTRLAFRVR